METWGNGQKQQFATPKKKERRYSVVNQGEALFWSRKGREWGEARNSFYPASRPRRETRKKDKERQRKTKKDKERQRKTKKDKERQRKTKLKGHLSAAPSESTNGPHSDGCVSRIAPPASTPGGTIQSRGYDAGLFPSLFNSGDFSCLFWIHLGKWVDESLDRILG